MSFDVKIGEGGGVILKVKILFSLYVLWWRDLVKPERPGLNRVGIGEWGEGGGAEEERGGGRARMRLLV